MSRKTRKFKLLDDVEEVALDEEGKRELKALNKALSESKTSNNSTYFFMGEVFHLWRGVRERYRA